MEETKPKLNDIAAFRSALANYRVSDHAHEVLKDMKLVVMVGLAAGGRNTLINRLVRDHNYVFIVSDTTRPPKFRDGRMEQDGIHYYFRREADMLRDIQNGEFLEAEIIHNQQVSGTSIRELERVKNDHKIAIHDFEFGGADHVAQAKPDAYIIGLLPPDYDEWMRRFHARETVDAEEFINRMQTAKSVLESMLEKPYFRLVVNEDVDSCVEELRAIIERDEYTPEIAATGRLVAESLLERVNETLAQHA